MIVQQLAGNLERRLATIERAWSADLDAVAQQAGGLRSRVAQSVPSADFRAMASVQLGARGGASETLPLARGLGSHTCALHSAASDSVDGRAARSVAVAMTSGSWLRKLLRTPLAAR